MGHVRKGNNCSASVVISDRERKRYLRKITLNRWRWVTDPAEATGLRHWAVAGFFAQVYRGVLVSQRDPSKLFVALLLVLSLLASAATAADINAGHSWLDGDTVVASDLNALVGSASINSSFYTGKAVVTAPGALDQILLYSTGLS